MDNISNKINKLKKEKNAVILAHYYVDEEVQKIADYVGDSFYLSKIATQVKEDTIVFCGVSFMGESAKTLNPSKTVLMPDVNADCPMAHMADEEKIRKVKAKYEDTAVVCYVNSSAKLKSLSDVCVTSSNALKIVKNLPNKNIFFIPDENLGRYIASKVSDKNFIFNDGYCPVHKRILKEDILKAKNEHKNALVLAHPECTSEVLEQANYIGSTSGIIDYAQSSDSLEFIIATETGVFYNLKSKSPNKTFYPVIKNQICPDMKLINLEKVLHVLETGENEMKLDKELIDNSYKPLKRMLELSK